MEKIGKIIVVIETKVRRMVRNILEQIHGKGMHAVVQAVAVGGRGHHPTKYVETSYLHNIDRDREMTYINTGKLLKRRYMVCLSKKRTPW